MDKNELASMKEEFISLLRSTSRDGVEDVIEYLEKEGFFTQPASSNKHLATEGGLLAHSLNTCKAALMLWEQLQKMDPALRCEVRKESVILTSLLHDVCKTDIYHRTTLKKKVDGIWQECEGYSISYRNFPMGHGEKSLVLLLCTGLEMYDDEMLAIRWHMGAWGVNMLSYEETKNCDAALKRYPLVGILQSADSIAANILERGPEDTDGLQ